MAIDYTEIAAGALESLEEAGAAATLTVPGSGTYDPATGGATYSPASSSAVAVLLPPGAMKGTGMVFSTDVTARAQAWMLMAASGLAATPVPGCTVLFGGTTYSVIGADTLKPAGVAVLHGLALVVG
jgi:hypothetical protein